MSAAVNLTSWFSEHYVSSSAPNWQVQMDNPSRVLQTRNSDPGFFCSDFDATGRALEGSITVETRFDDDFIGFALGFAPGDTTNANASYVLIDWKQGNQNFFDTTGKAGLATSRVTGIPTLGQLWGHDGLEGQPGVLELARGNSLGSTGWIDNQGYDFRFEVTPTEIKTFINEQLEMSVTGSFGDLLTGTSFCFYNFSQERVKYSGITSAIIPTTSPSAAPSHSRTPSAVPSILPSNAPSCLPGKFTDECLPLIYLTNVLPSSGNQNGGFVTRVQGFNMNDGNILCHFGPDYTVNGTFISDAEISCVAPSYTLTDNSEEGREVVELSITIDGEGSLNSLLFEFFGQCPPTSCINGYCAGGECFCDPGFSGEACDETVIAPVIDTIPNQEAIVDDLFELTPVLTDGTMPIVWSITSSPFDAGLSIDAETGLIRLLSTSPKTLQATVTVENEGYLANQVFDINVLPSYSIDAITASPTELLTGSLSLFVRIEGVCIDRITGDPKPFCDAEIFVEKNGFRRVLGAVGGQDGSFATAFIPYKNEGGEYRVGGQVPGTKSETAVTAFAINGMYSSPATTDISGLTGESVNATAIISSVNPEANLTGLSVDIVDEIPAELSSVSLSLHSMHLDNYIPSTTMKIQVGVVSVPVSALLEYRVMAANSLAIATGRIRISIRAPSARLSVSPGSLDLRCTGGKRSQAALVVTNNGAAPTGQLQVVLPANFALLGITSGAISAPLLPGETSTIVFHSIPGPDEPFQTWNGKLQISSSGPESGVLVNFQIEISSDEFGSVRVIVEDEYTFYADGAPKLSGAEVSLENLVTGETYQNISDRNGEALFSGIPYGSYQLRASATNHSEHYEVVLLENPQEELVYAFLALRLVSYSWSVTPTLVEDEYEVAIETTFTAYVPAPVIVIEPIQINLSVLRPGVDQINFKITNYGLVAANNFEFDLPSANGLSFVPIFDGPVGDIPANSTVYYPVKVESLTATNIFGGRELAGACTSGLAIYSVECKDTEWHFTKIGYIILNFECPSGNADIVRPLLGEGGCCLHPVSAVGGTEVVACECQIAIFECIESFLKLPRAYNCMRAALKCANLARGGGSPDAVAACTVGAMRPCRGLATPPPIVALQCAKSLLESCFAPPTGSGPPGRRDLQVELEDQIAAQNFQESSNAIEIFIEVAYYSFGGYADWNELSEEQLEEFQFRLGVASADESENGTLISDSELVSLVTPPLENISARISEFVTRWNRTLDYYSKGIYTIADVPLGEETDMIDLDYLNQQYELIEAADMEAQLRGYEDVAARWLADRDAFITASNRARDGICAKVRVQIKQRAVLVRNAFEAELQIENGGSDMLDIRIEVIIRERETGELSTVRFVIDNPKLVGITGVGGFGMLAADTSGSASWLFLALGEAAPTEASVEYDVSGTFSYRSNSVNTTITLQPETIVVSPDPQLELIYFHEYEIYGDDPFTIEVEPPVPYKLAVLVKNVGFGDAIDLRIESSQPTIIENDKGLLVDFKILSAEVNGQPAIPSLLVDFQSIPAQSNAVGVWNLVSSLQGFFSDYSATFTYKGPIEDDRLALVNSVDIFELSHCVLVDAELEGRGGGVSDGLDDFLINKLPDIDRLPDTLVSSFSGNESPVFTSLQGTVLLSEATFDQDYDRRVVVDMQLPSVPDAIASPVGDWFYFRLVDPVSSDYVLQSVIRVATETELRLDSNVWRTAKTKRYVGEGAVDERFLHIFDFDSPTGVFELRYSTFAGPSNFTVSELSNTSALLSWSAPSGPGPYHYNVLQKIASQPDTLFALIASNIQSTVVSAYSLSPGTAYSFRLVSTNEDKVFSSGTVLDASIMMSGNSVNPCGNGIIDESEECDDGNNKNGDCCSSSCLLEPAGTVCRGALGDCDVADFCDGISPICGANLLASFGTECGFDEIKNCNLICSGVSTICPDSCIELPSASPSIGPSALPSFYPSEMPSPLAATSSCPCNQRFRLRRWLCTLLNRRACRDQ